MGERSLRENSRLIRLQALPLLTSTCAGTYTNYESLLQVVMTSAQIFSDLRYEVTSTPALETADG